MLFVRDFVITACHDLAIVSSVKTDRQQLATNLTQTFQAEVIHKKVGNKTLT